jgi:thioredoxin-related protein
VVNNVAATAAPSVEDESTKIGVSEDDQSTKIDASYTPTTKQNHKSPSTENATTDVEEKRSTIRWGLWLCGIGIVVIIITSILLNRPKDSANSDSQSTTLMRSLSTQDSHQKMKKYSDMLELPHGLDGYFDLDEAIAAAKREHKPLFIDVTGHACNNCREMETRVWSDNRVMNLLENKYIICALYVDDKTALAPEDYYTSSEGKQMTELGRKLR